MNANVFFFTNSYFLFDRSQMDPPGRSEIHSLKFTSPNRVDIDVHQSNGPSVSKWKYIGSVKTSKHALRNIFNPFTAKDELFRSGNLTFL